MYFFLGIECVMVIQYGSFYLVQYSTRNGINAIPLVELHFPNVWSSSKNHIFYQISYCWVAWRHSYHLFVIIHQRVCSFYCLSIYPFVSRCFVEYYMLRWNVFLRIMADLFTEVWFRIFCSKSTLCWIA